MPFQLWYLIPAVIVLIFALMGLKRGFVKEFISLVGVVVAVILAFFLSAPCASYIYENFATQKVHEKVQALVPDNSEITSEGGGSLNLDKIKELIPPKYADAAESVGVNLKEAIDSINFKDGESVAETVRNAIEEKIAQPVVQAVLRIVIFIVLFILIRILLGIIVKCTNLVTKLPGIKMLNKLLGFVFGLAKGGIIVYAIIYCYNFVSPIL